MQRKLEVAMEGGAASAAPAPPQAGPANGAGIGYAAGGGAVVAAAPGAPAATAAINPYNGRPYSQRYYQILATRQGERGGAGGRAGRRRGAAAAV